MIRTKIFFGVFGLSLLFVSVTGLIINQTYAKTLRQNEENYNILASDSVRSQFDFTVDLIQRTASSLSVNSEVRSFLADGKTPAAETTASCRKLLSNAMSMESFLDGIQVIGKNGQLCATNLYLETQDALIDTRQYFTEIAGVYPKRAVWSGMHAIKNGPGGGDEVVSCIYPVTDPATAELNGLIVVHLSYDFIREEFVNYAITSGEKAFIVSQTGKIVMNQPRTTSFEPLLATYPDILKKKELILDKKVFGVDAILVSKSLNLIDWKIVRIIPTSTITAQTARMNGYFRILLLLSVICSLLYALLLSRAITRPIQALNKACKHIEGGDLSYHVPVRGRDELSKLGNTFNIMVSQLNTYFKKEIENERQKAELRFRMLQAQINPHFLYNTLDSIKWLAVMQNTPNIAEMTTALSQLLKYNLGPADSSATLQEELESIRNYITIQKYRYLDTFQFTEEIAPEAVNCRILRFCLQPLVENCILHGFQNTERTYRIKLSAFLEGDTLRIQVADNGEGMDSQTVKALNTGKKSGSFSRIGVRNIRERIHLYYGGGYGLTYNSVPGEGTLAEVTVPKRLTDETKEEAHEDFNKF